MRVKKIRGLAKLRVEQNKLEYFRSYALFYKGKLADRLISEVIRLIDAEKAVIDYTLEQVRVNAQYCDMNARKIFLAGLSASMMKCIAGINLHRERNAQINYGLVISEYP